MRSLSGTRRGFGSPARTQILTLARIYKRAGHMDKYDTFQRRLFAGFIDGLVFIPIYFLDSISKSLDDTPLIVLGLLISNASLYVYSILMHWKYGQTIGKMAMKVRVIDISETRLLSLKQSFMRDSVYVVFETLGLLFVIFQVIKLGHYDKVAMRFDDYYIDWFGFIWFILELVTMMTNDKRRAIHDFMANSVVINEEYWKRSDVE
jgi:uncharacterized RDD family membrane protein YckC